LLKCTKKSVTNLKWKFVCGYILKGKEEIVVKSRLEMLFNKGMIFYHYENRNIGVKYMT